MKVINIWGAPAAGKSTVAAGLFLEMKAADYNVELINEFAKDVTWEGHKDLLKDQLYLLGQQNRKLERLRDKVDYVISDSPLLLTLAYTPESYYKSFDSLVYEVWNSYDNLNFFIIRTHPYRQVGRVHTEEQSAALNKRIAGILDQYTIPTTFFYEDTKKVVEGVFEIINKDHHV